MRPAPLVCIFATTLALMSSRTRAADPAADLVVRVSARTGLTVFVSAAPGRSIPVKPTNGRSAAAPIDFLQQHGSRFGLRDPARQLHFDSARTDVLGQTHSTYRQFHRGIPVFSGLLKVHQDAAGRFIAANGRFYPIPETLSIVPTLTSEQAETVAIEMLGGGSATAVDTELVIVDPGWYGDPTIGPHLAYYVAVSAPALGMEEAFFIDARRGDVLDRWSLMCLARDRRVHLHTAVPGEPLPGPLARAEGDPPTGNAEVDPTYDYMGDTYDYFLRAFGRDGLDGAGGAMVATVNSNAVPCPNAAWSFIDKQAVFCPTVISDDLVAHEMTHGLTQFTANLIYQNQSGQINESYSDVFGELVDLYNGDASLPGPPGGTPWPPTPTGPGVDTPNNLRVTCSPGPSYGDGVRWLFSEDSVGFGGAIRDLWSPPCLGDPDRANSSLQTCSLGDNGGVHSGSGIVNHAFVILCDGKTFNGQTVTGIGPIKAGAVWYRALTVYLTVASDFEDAFLAFNQAATDLIGTFPNDPRTGSPSASMFTAADAAEVNKALLAVEMNTPGACGETVPVLNAQAPLQCATRLTVFADDFEAGVNGWTVTNSAPPTVYDWVQTAGLPLGRPGTGWFCDDPNIGDCAAVDESSTHALTSPVIAVPGGLETLTLAFAHFVETEPRFDGGNVQISVNGGPWQALPAAAYRYNTYNTSLFTAVEQGNTNPLAGQVVFSGVGGQWGTSLVDLGAFVTGGDTLQVRFEFGKDGCFGFTGWFIDDVEIYGCTSSGDCNTNGIPDEIDRAQGPAPERLLQQVANGSSGNLSDADPHPSLGINKLAENFLLLHDAVVHSLNIWGGYTGNTPVPDVFTVVFHQDASGLPGAVIASETAVPSSRTLTGRQFLGVDEYAYTLTLASPVALPAGTYVVEIFNDTTGSSTTFIWERALFGWIPGVARLGQDCPTWCYDNLPNFSLELFGGVIGRARGDLNADGVIDEGDLGAFVDVLVNGATEPDVTCAADLTADGLTDGLDVSSFVNCLVNGACP